jgi:hypothetical protein
MTRAGRNRRLIVLGLLTFALAVALVARRSPSRGQALAYTSCTARGPRLVMDVSRIAPEDTLPVRLHEEVHVGQCRDLGWAAMQWKNLTAAGRLTLEAPGYCAGARARLRRGDDFRVTRERLFDDANAMFAGSLDSSRVNSALRAACAEFAASVVQ